MKPLLIAAIGLILTSPVLARPGMAAMTEKDALVIARIIGFLHDGPKGNVNVAILADTPASRQDANQFAALTKGGKRVRDITMFAEVIGLEELNSTTAQIIIIPDGMSAAQFDHIYAIAKEKKLVTISTSSACLIAKRCAIAIKSEPAVDISMSQSVAADTNVHFNSALRMMIKETP